MHALLASSLLFAALLPRPSLQEDALPAPDAAITRAELEHHARFLASDALAGRAALTEGSERAAQYLARALASFGLEPAGEEGTFFQDTGRRRRVYPKQPVLRLQRADGTAVEAEVGVDFTLHPRGRARSTELLPLAFFYDYNHARMPLAGRPAEAIYFGASKADKQRILGEKGIVGLSDWGLEFELLPGDKSRTPGKPGAQPERIVEGAEAEGCERIELRGRLLDEFERRGFTHAQLLVEEAEAPLVERNVVARIPGVGTTENPGLAREVVLLSTHYDHLGRRKNPRKEGADEILNGAEDASGAVALLELAQALARGAKPARTLVFVFLAGEESGGSGSARYLAAPPVPLSTTVAGLALERLGRPDLEAGGAGKLWLTAFERTTLGPALGQRVPAIVADPRPDRRFFQAYPSYAFALEGVVAQTLSSFADHVEHRTVRDEVDTLDFAHLEAAARAALEAVHALADGTLTPTWLEGRQPKKLEVPERGPRSAEEKAAERERRRAQRAEPGADGGDDDEEPAQDSGEDEAPR